MVDEEFIKFVGKNIRFFREQKKLTQSDLAAMLNMDDGNYRRIESGRTSPTLQTLLRISKALDVPVQDFLLDLEELKLLQYYRSIPTPQDTDIYWGHIDYVKRAKEKGLKKS